MLDVNDETPEFPFNVYKGEVEENLSPGSVVLVVTPVDKDDQALVRLRRFFIFAELLKYGERYITKLLRHIKIIFVSTDHIFYYKTAILVTYLSRSIFLTF